MLGRCPKPRKEPEVPSLPAYCLAACRKAKDGVWGLRPQAGSGGSPAQL